MKTTKKTLEDKIIEKTGLSRPEARKALKLTLKVMAEALRMGKAVGIPRLGRLVVVQRKPARRPTKNLRHVGPGVFDVHKKHKKSVRLLGGKDLSDNPLPTIVHEKESEPKVPPRSKRVAVAIPSWRVRRRFR